MAAFAFDFASDFGAGENEAWVAYQKSWCPPWLLGTFGAELQRILGEAKGWHADRAKAAVQARFVDLAPEDALADLGKDRAMLRAPSETTDGYRARLLQAFEIWQTAGTEAGILTLLDVAEIENATIAEDRDLDGALGHWARWYVYAQEPHPFVAPLTFGADIVFGEDWTIGFGSRAAVDYTKAVLRRWKPSHTRCLGVVVEWASVPGFAVLQIDDTVIGVGAPPTEDTLTDPNLFAILTPEGDIITDGTAA